MERVGKSLAEKPVRTLVAMVFAGAALVLVLIVAVFIFRHFGSILGTLIALPFLLLAIYKIFTGFPAIFSAVVQVAAIFAIGICLVSLAAQHQRQLEGRSMNVFERIQMADALKKDFGVPPFLSMLILTETGALIGIASGIGFGLLAEASAGIVTASFNLARINGSIKTPGQART